MTVDQCSIDAYYQTEPKRNVQRVRVYEAVKKYDQPSCSDISKGLDLPRASVCGRLRELENEGLIRKAGRKLDNVTNVTVNWYEAVVE